MKRSVLMAACLLASMAGTASATPFRMDYCKTDLGGGLYRYEITLTLDNNDGSWFAGQGIGWIIFGDIPSAASPFNDFQMDPASYPIGPYTELTSSGGGHNGPTLGPIWTPPGPPTLLVFNLWTPNAIGDSIDWAGTSASDLQPGQLTWSNLWTGGGANNANWAVAEVDCGSTCYADCNLSGGLSVGDFGCFQGKYVLGDLYADCNASGGLSVADFGCFQGKYVLGCP
ncbi:MAG: hypothetical protein ACKVU4_13850 [Phycisphaerales bacterium]